MFRAGEEGMRGNTWVAWGEGERRGGGGEEEEGGIITAYKYVRSSISSHWQSLIDLC